MSGEVKHTLGPWRKAGGSLVDPAGRQVLGRGSGIAQMMGYSDDNEAAEHVANGILRNAAPELLTALKELANEIGALKAFEWEVRATIGNTNWNVLIGKCEAARAAIAAATGAGEGR